MWYINLSVERPLGHEAERFGRPCPCAVSHVSRPRRFPPTTACVLVIEHSLELSLLDTHNKLFGGGLTMDGLSDVISEMLKAYPNPDGPRPIANYPATMYGVVITFHVGCSRHLRNLDVDSQA